MNRILSLAFLLYIGNTLYAQQSVIDSLTGEFNTTSSDTAKASILSKIGIALYSTDIISARKINDSLISFSKGKSEKYLGQGYRMEGTFSLLDGDYERSSEYYHKALEIAEGLEERKLEGAILGSLGTLYGRQGESEKAIEYYHKSIKVNKATPSLNVRNYINLAITVTQNFQLEKSVEYLIKALEIAEKSNPSQLPYIHNQLAISYFELNTYDKGEYHLNKALPLAKELGDNYSLGSIYNSLGYLNETRDFDYTKSLDHYSQSLKYHTLANNKVGMSNANYNVGLQYLNLKKPYKAEEYFKEGAEISNRLGNTLQWVIGYYFLATVYIDSGDFVKSERYIARANDSLKGGSKMLLKDHFYRMSKSYESHGKYNEAHSSMEMYAELADSLFNKTSFEKLAGLEEQYESEKKENDNLKLRAEKARQAELLAQENKRKWLLGGGLIMAVLGLGIFAFYYRKNQKQKKIIIDLQKELHHRVKNNLAIIDRFVKTVQSEFSDPKFDGKLRDLRNRIKSISEVHELLNDKDDITHLGAKKYIETIINNISQSFANPNVVISSTIDESIHLLPNKLFSIGIIVNEFITNSYKYAFDNKEGIITINFDTLNNGYILKLSDNGKGLPSDIESTSSNSFGFRLMQLYTQKLNGTFEMSNNEGVHIQIIFPKTIN